MITLKEWRQLKEGEYCDGLSINADMVWNEFQDFLTTRNSKILEELLPKAAVYAKMKVVDTRRTTYGENPEFGFSYLVVLGQSHVMIHTWPEKKGMNIDVFTCGNEGNPMGLLDYIIKALKPDKISKFHKKRGFGNDIETVWEKPTPQEEIKPVNPTAPNLIKYKP